MPWAEQIAEIARSNGWAVHRCGQGGFPVLFLARRGRFVIVDTGHHRGFQADRWRHEFGLLPLIEQRTWQPADVDAVRAELA